jgi:hypothetical protein
MPPPAPIAAEKGLLICLSVVLPAFLGSTLLLRLANSTGLLDLLFFLIYSGSSISMPLFGRSSC